MNPSSLKKPTPPVETMIVNTITRHARPQRIFLFGSRAREDAQERSDYDVAIDDEQLTRAALARIRADWRNCRRCSQSISFG